VLVALTGGEHASSFNDRTDEDVVAEAIEVLRTLFDTVPEPLAAIVTRWETDPFARGSYSHVPPGASPEDHETLAEPVSPRLVLAGEHTIREFPSTVHGAYLSGLRAAEQIFTALA
jgi:monoamine oxidase